MAVAVVFESIEVVDEVESERIRVFCSTDVVEETSNVDLGSGHLQLNQLHIHLSNQFGCDLESSSLLPSLLQNHPRFRHNQPTIPVCCCSLDVFVVSELLVVVLVNLRDSNFLTVLRFKAFLWVLNLCEFRN